MTDTMSRFDVVVLGGGPAGQKAAIEAAQAGRHVLIIERERAVGGECVHRGTIPSKTLRESAMFLSGLRRRTAGVLDLNLSPDLKVASLMRRLSSVLQDQEEVLSDQMYREGIEIWADEAVLRAAIEAPSQRSSGLPDLLAAGPMPGA